MQQCEKSEVCRSPKTSPPPLPCRLHSTGIQLSFIPGPKAAHCSPIMGLSVGRDPCGIFGKQGKAKPPLVSLLLSIKRRPEALPSSLSLSLSLSIRENPPTRPVGSLFPLLVFEKSKSPRFRSMAEEQRCQEGPRCANNCGFFGSSATLNLCSKCYRDHLKTEQDLIAVEKSFLASTFSSSSSSPSTALSSSPPSSAAAAAAPEVAVETVAEGPRRCTTCRKKVGLTGFKCRCGSTFCGAHRYPEQHACGFDYRAAGREAIARSNPVVQADKLQKI